MFELPCVQSMAGQPLVERWKSRVKTKKIDYGRWLLVLPALIVVGTLLVYPIFSSLYYRVVLRTIWVFNNFDIIYLITGGGPANATTTVPIYAYNMGWGTKLLGRSSAVTVLLLAFLLIVCFIYFKIIGRWEKEDK